MAEVRRPYAKATCEPWGDLVTTFVIAVLTTGVLVAGFIFGIDPYGTRANVGRGPSPIMDNNQRHMYPQIARRGRYDGVVFGTSTMRLLDPERLAELFGGRFANLGINGGTPWEQLQLVELFLRHTPAPGTVIWGIDADWCKPDADRRRTTRFSFPAWLYDENAFNDLPGHLNLRALQIAGRVALNRLGLMRERIRSDGYDRFLPPDGTYDLGRARQHVEEMRHPSWAAPAASRQETAATIETPALSWLDDVLSRLPEATKKLLLFPPVHVSAQPAPETLDSQNEAECKARVAAIGKRHGAVVLDFRIPSSITRDDSNFWDSLHYRIAIAERLAASLQDPPQAEGRSSDGSFEVLSPGR